MITANRNIPKITNRIDDINFKGSVANEMNYFCEYHPKGYGAALLALIDIVGTMEPVEGGGS